MKTSDFRTLLSNWCNLDGEPRILIVTDQKQAALAEAIAGELGAEIRFFDKEDAALRAEMAALEQKDLLIALFGLETFVFGGANRIFLPFRKPQGVDAQSIFIRLDISEGSLREGLATPREMVDAKCAELAAFGEHCPLRVTSCGGTDLRLTIRGFATCSHDTFGADRHAFLPPSESTSAVVPGTGEGCAVIDVTVGQLYHFGQLLGEYGLTDQPVTAVIEKGMLTDLYGSPMADDLRRKLFALDPACRQLVELGHGLSKMKPCGLIGVDESIIDTCHLGFGDGGSCGVHLDLVLKEHKIEKYFGNLSEDGTV